MAFWKKKRKEARETVELEPKEEYRPSAPYIGRVIIDISEYEKGKFKNKKVKLDEEKRVIKVINDSAYPVYNIKIKLKNNQNTDLPKEIIISSLGTAEGERVYEREFKVKNYSPPIMLEPKLVFPENQGFVYMGQTNTLWLELKLKSNIKVENGSIQVSFKPGDVVRIANYDQPTIGQVSSYTSNLEWTISSMEKGEEATIKIELNLEPTSPDEVNIGTINSRVSINGRTFSGIEVEEATSRFLLQFGASKHEIEDKPGHWEITVFIENRHDRPVQAEGTIEILDGEIIEVQHEGLSQKQGKLELTRVIVDSNSRVSLGPIIVKSDEIPKVKISVGGSVNEEVNLTASGEYELLLPNVSVAGLSLEKEAKIIVDKNYEGYVGQGEIPTLGKNSIKVQTTIQNIGGVPISELEIIESLHESLNDPENIKVKIGNTELQANTEIKGDGETKELIIKIAIPEGLKPKDTIVVTYELTPKREARETEIALSSRVLAKPTPEAKPIELVLDDMKTPRIRIRHITRNIEVFKRVEPTETKDEFLIIITVENKGEFPVLGYTIKQRIPNSFEIISVNPEAKRKETKTAVELSWIVDLDPLQQKELAIRVRGKEGYSIDEIMSIQTF